MDRRRFLGTVGAGLVAGAAGCLGRGPPAAPGADTGTATAAPTPTAGAGQGPLTDVDLPLDRLDLRRGAPKDAIPAITDPAFGEGWSGVDGTLEGTDRIIGIEVDGEARAYPIAVLNWHEVVNDDFGGPLLVTFCPLCGSGVTADRRVDGEVTTFGVSGKLWNSDLVLYDELTGSLWSQILGKAVRGPRTGESLSLRPSTITTWRQWREDYPETSVLLPPPASDTVNGEVWRDYDANPYSGYEETQRIGIGGHHGADERLHPKTSVVGIASDGAARAYPAIAVRDEGGIVNDRVGDRPVVVATADGSLVAYIRRADGETLTFARDGDTLTAGGSRWALASGRALDGPHEGATLDRANDRSEMFWFAWAEFYPGTDIYGEVGTRAG